MPRSTPLQQPRKELNTASTPLSNEDSQESQPQKEDQRPEERPPLPELPPPLPPKPRHTTHKVDGEDIIQVQGKTETTTTVRVAEHLLNDLDAVLDKEEFPPGSKERLEIVAKNIQRQFEKKKPSHPPIPFLHNEESNSQQQGQVPEII
ncbi:unnamed protein product [Cylicostephanus goldi]|uniref:Uncharacterized protein n=1 Tax=Cylicostephanus goldi TaxID=71465 RepID=A0A3P6Q339_CYLGO|nr:unnamed protein product [Cylicostephanus goldi]